LLLRFLIVTALLLLAFAPSAGGTRAEWRARAPSVPDKNPGWLWPVEGQPVRGFDLGANPFEGGRHRGVDLAAAPGDPVRSACAGRVAFAGQVADAGRVVSVVCGRWRVTYLPLRSIAVRPRARVARGSRLGTTGVGRHRGLHVGVRREGNRFGYVDPLQFFGDRTGLPIPLVGRPRRTPRGLPAEPPRRPAHRPLPAPENLPRRAPAPAGLPRPVPAPTGFPRPAPAPALPRAGPASSGLPLAPWPAWLGLGLVLAGTFGTTAFRVRRRRARPAPSALPAGNPDRG
jgi:hypothetical protein